MLTLPRAIRIASTIAERMAPHCEQIDIAGSIRRRRDTVGDIDIVLLPKPGHRPALQAKFRSAGWDVIADGDQNSIYRRSLVDREPLQVDLFWATPAASDLFTHTPTNYGSILLCRTGSVHHNIHLIEHAKKLGLRWDPYQGVYRDDTLIAAATEQDIFSALQLDFIAPEHRER